MKKFLLICNILFFIIILILFFQNIGGTIEGFWFLIFQTSKDTNSAVLALSLITLGFLSGAFATMLAINILKQKAGDEEPGGQIWNN